MTNIEAAKADLSHLTLEDNPALVKAKSRDFFWYSPVLKEQLDHITGDFVVTPKNEAEVREVLAVCFRHDVPVTTRGNGTGNYGQAMPLSGGCVLNLAEMDHVKEIREGSLIVEPGAVIANIDKSCIARSRQEMRMHPSTKQTATIGGFIAGGSGGVGSINWGGLRDHGNITRLKVVTMEAEPRTLELTGMDLHKVTHAYGTNGVITEIEMPLTAAYDWVDVLVSFEDFNEAATVANELGQADGLLLKEIAVIQAPLPQDYFLRHKPFLKDGESLVALMVAPQSLDAVLALVNGSRGELIFRADKLSASELKGIPPVYELTWNHTTLRGLRVDPSITYLQVLYPYPRQLEKVRRIGEIFGDEVPGHLEFVRFDGNVTCFGLPVVRYTTPERLEEIMKIHEAEGCPIFNPHRYTLEEGGMKQTDEVQLAFKKEADPKGLLNPGKMVAWDNPDFDFSGQTYLFPGLQTGV